VLLDMQRVSREQMEAFQVFHCPAEILIVKLQVPSNRADIGGARSEPLDASYTVCSTRSRIAS